MTNQLVEQARRWLRASRERAHKLRELSAIAVELVRAVRDRYRAPKHWTDYEHRR